MKNLVRVPLLLVLSGMMILLLAEAESARAAALQALRLCACSVIPALFPALALSSALTALGFGEWVSPLLARWMTPLFRLPGAAGSAVVLGLMGGYPIGARTAAELYRNGALTRQEAQRLLTFCNNSNPVFLISLLGAGVFSSVRTGVWLWLIHLLAALLVGLVFRRGGGRSVPPPVPPRAQESAAGALVRAVGDAALSMVRLCGFVVLFYVLSRPLLCLGGRTAALAVGVTELFSLTPLLTADRFSFILASGCAGWGGLSVLGQTAAALEGSGLSLRPCLLGKLLHGLLSAALAALLAPYILG